MTTPGWYEDYAGSGRLRYHDGEQWTDHLHPPGSANVDPADQVDKVDSTDSVQVATAASADVPPKGDGPLARLLSVATIGVFIGVMFGGFLFNAAGSLTPTTEEAGTVERIDIEYSVDRNRRVGDDERYVLEGTTASGTAWRIVNEDAYRQLEREGYPQPVTVAIGDWTGVAERVTGTTWSVDHQTTGATVGFVVVLGLIGLGVLGGAWFVLRSDTGGPSAALVFLLATLVIGNWLGWQMFRWIQSG